VALGNCDVANDRESHTRILAVLEPLAATEDTVIAEHARWAIERLSAAD